MGIYVSDSPVNPVQVISAIGSTGCTVREIRADGTWEVEVEDFSAEDIEVVVASIVYDEAAEL